MATLTIKNIPNELYLKLKAAASVNRRSINNEVIYCIENVISSSKVDPEEFIHHIHKFYENVDVPELTDEMLKNIKENGRP